MVDFAQEGLLDGLRGRARAARLRLLERLEGEGVSLDDLREAVTDDTLVLLPAERLVGGIKRYTPREVSEASGLELDLLIRLRRAQGLPIPDVDAPVFTEADIEGAKTARTFREFGIREEDMLQVVRVLGRGLSQAAELMRTMTLELVLVPDADEYELAMRYADAVASLEPLTEPMLGQMINLHLRHVVSGEILDATARKDGRLSGARPIAVAFADLVGFTRIGEAVPPEELGRVAGRLEAMAADVVISPAKLVKTIGDAVMIVSPEPAGLLDVILELVELADSEGEDFPQLRAGLAHGPALSRAGDWYGHPVNLASRVTSVAYPGSVLVDGSLRDCVDGDPAYRWSFAGERRLKGISEPAALFRARRAEPDTDAG
ncbi:MAG TPA: adenylate cyclase regulatory domain-containing protein [Solirubrobacteraceae bacterium]